MDIEQIQSLANQSESNTVEFKTSTAQLKSAFEVVCAFLNGEGGTVLIGVNDKGKIVGQDVTDNTKQEISRELNKIEPPAEINVRYVSVEKNKYVIAIQVEARKHAPYIYDGRAFQRNQTSISKMSQHRYEQLLIERGQLNHSWEESIAANYTIDDLDQDEIRLAIRQGIAVGRIPTSAENETIESILKSWKLIEGGRLNNAAVVLFAKDVLPRYAQCHLKLGRFRGVDMLGDYVDNKEFYGNTFRMFEEANSFITRHLPIASFFEPDRFERIDKPALPVLAVREALVNAICHRDYSNRSTSITLAIFDDRMEIWNNGILPPTLKINDLKKKHKSVPRNKIIAKVFYDRKYFEGWGTGIIKIFDLCRENDVPEPMYQEYSGGIEVTFKFKELIAITRQAIPVKQPLSARQEAILSIIQKHARVSLKQIIDELENPPSARMIRIDLNSLKRYGLVEIKGSARSSIWTLKK